MPDPTLDRMATLARVRGLATAILDGCANVEAEAIKLAESVLTLLSHGPEMTRGEAEAKALVLHMKLSDSEDYTPESVFQDRALITTALLEAAASAALSERLKCAERIAELEREVERLKAATVEIPSYSQHDGPLMDQEIDL